MCPLERTSGTFPAVESAVDFDSSSVDCDSSSVDSCDSTLGPSFGLIPRDLLGAVFRQLPIEHCLC